MQNADNSDQLVSYSTESEAAVIGAVLKENSVIEHFGFLLPEHFYAAVHQRIFKACRDKFYAGELANPLTLRMQFDQDEDLKETGGGRYLVQCMASASYTPVPEARYVRDMALRRKLVETCDRARADLTHGKIDIGDVSAYLAAICEKVSAGGEEWALVNGEQVAQSIIDGMNTYLAPMPTGIATLDDAMDGGLFPGKLYGFAGKKKHGKTILAGTVSCNLATAGVKHLFVCGEMSPQEIHRRNLARVGVFYENSFRNGYSKSEDFKKRLAVSMQWAQKNILYRNAPGVTFDKLKQIISHAISHERIKGFILDYLQLVGGKDARKSGAEHLDEVAQWLADTCRKHNVFGIVMAQINQEGNTRGGEGLRLACDQMYAIQRPDVTAPGMWLEMMDTRYTAWANVGSENSPGFSLEPKGPWFKEN